MTTVAVVGGGVAGLAAARSACEHGAEVTLLESESELPPPRSQWPRLIDAKGPMPGPCIPSGVRLELGSSATRVTEDGKVLAGGAAKFDAVVLATGCGPREEARTSGRAGVHHLGSHHDYFELGVELPRLTRVCMAGSGPTTLLVAERILARSIPTTVFSPDILSSVFDEGCASVILAAAAGAGLQMVGRLPERVVGYERVEGAVAGGRVYPCDCYVVVPKRAPRVPKAPVGLGRGGGVLVDDRMRSASPRIFAAGDCAEPQLNSEPSARLTGAVAGANATGLDVPVRPIGVLSLRLFGVEASCAGLNLACARASGLDALQATGSVGGLTCTLVFAAEGLRLLGVQLVGDGSDSLAQVALLAASHGVTLGELAGLECQDSSDITALRDTARRELARRKEW